MTVVFTDPDVNLHHGDTLNVLYHLDGPPADAVVTSPPYLDARDDVSSFNLLQQYLDWASGWLANLGVGGNCSPSASLMLNVGRLHPDGEEIPLADELRRVACASGWHWIDTLIWHKVNGGGGRKLPYLLDRHEYVLWLAKTTDPYKGFEEARQPYSPATLARYTRRRQSHIVGKHVTGGGERSGDGRREAHPDGALPGG